MTRPTLRRRDESGRRDDSGSAVALMPILGLLVCAGVAALAGIALQPSESVAAEIPNPELGPACSTVVGPAPDGAAKRVAWLESLATCIQHRIEGTTYDADGDPTGTAPVSGAERFGDVTVQRTFGGDPRLVVRWEASSVPSIVVARIGEVPNDAHAVFVVTQAPSTGNAVA